MPKEDPVVEHMLGESGVFTGSAHNQIAIDTKRRSEEQAKRIQEQAKSPKKSTASKPPSKTEFSFMSFLLGALITAAWLHNEGATPEAALFGGGFVGVVVGIHWKALLVLGALIGFVVIATSGN